jgi:hypothetical protein
VTFPLAFTPMEYYFWCDDRREYPTCYPFELEFSGSLDRHRFATAWTAAIDRHPLLRALVDDSGSRPMWIEGNGEIPEFEWAEVGVPILGLTEQLDLTAKPGIRCWLRIGSESSRIVLRFHHACCDGLGALQFIEDLLLYYHREVHGEESRIAIRSLQPEALSHRGRIAQIPERPPFWLKLRYAIAISTFWAPLLWRRPAPLARSAESAGGVKQAAEQDYMTTRLDRSTVTRLRQKAAILGVTLNDLLMRDLFVIVGEWQIQNGGRATDWLRVNVPVSLRGDGDSQLPAAVRISFAFLTRRLRDCHDGEKLLQSISEEMMRIKKQHLSLRFLGGVDVAGQVGGMLKWFLNRKRSHATIVLSNLGRVLDDTQLPRRQSRLVCGDVVLEQISAIPPVRPFTRAAIVVLTYADELAVSMRGDPKFFDGGQVSKLLAIYVARLRQTARDEN